MGCVDKPNDRVWVALAGDGARINTHSHARRSANDGHLYLYNLETKKRTHSIHAHHNDVNAVTYADESGNVLFTGSDDGFCKVFHAFECWYHAPCTVGFH